MQRPHCGGVRIYRRYRRGLYTTPQSNPAEGSVSNPPVPQPPRPAVLVHRVTAPHGVREDPFYWLRDDARSDPQVLAYLQAETAYTQAVLAPVQPLIDRLYAEIVGRIKEDDSSVPVRYRGHWYASRFVSGGQYPLILRWPDQPRRRKR